jgi:hypothetical protein
VDDEDEPAMNGTDGDEAFLQLGVGAVIEFEKIDPGSEQLFGFPKADALLLRAFAGHAPLDRLCALAAKLHAARK